MARKFTQIAYTKSVKEAQEKYRSRKVNEKIENSEIKNEVLTEAESNFIKNMDTFFMASIGQNDWPYLQHRGGPKGFLKVIDNKTLAFPDFKGNLQYISVGNINAHNKVSLFFLDFVSKRRLKIWATAKVVELSQDPNLAKAVRLSDYRAKIERVIVFRVEAFDWNCPQHITQRFTLEEVAERESALLHHIDKLEKEISILQEKQMSLD